MVIEKFLKKGSKPDFWSDIHMAKSELHFPSHKSVNVGKGAFTFLPRTCKCENKATLL